MSKAEGNKQNGDKVLRAGDIIPPYKVRPAQASASQAESRSTGRPTAEHEIPRFNLAEEIMAEQRKVAAVKRKAPSRNGVIPIRPQGKTESVRHAVMPPNPLLFNQQQVIMEIVARDIAQMRRDFWIRQSLP